MRKSLKFELTLTIIVAVCFTWNSFYFTDFTFEGEFHLPRLIFYLIMIVSLFNAGLLTQKYIQFRKDKSSK
jgi:hypothetical protein